MTSVILLDELPSMTTLLQSSIPVKTHNNRPSRWLILIRPRAGFGCQKKKREKNRCVQVCVSHLLAMQLQEIYTPLRKETGKAFLKVSRTEKRHDIRAGEQTEAVIKVCLQQKNHPPDTGKNVGHFQSTSAHDPFQ